MWDRSKVPGGNVTRTVWKDLEQLPKHDIGVEDPNPAMHPGSNPLQKHHSKDEVEAIAAHLKRTLEGVVVDIFTKIKAASASGTDENVDPAPALKIRWVETYFPFTSPSWELEVFWENDWLEVLGCGVVQQSIPIAAGVPLQLGWAFGVGLERIAMILFSIPDIRLFWSQDPRFLSQFSTLDAIRPFVPFSKYPACYKDVAFWLTGTSSGAGGALGRGHAFHENDVMELVREVSRGWVEDVKLVDKFCHPISRRQSLCYRITYRSLERTLRNAEVNKMHTEVKRQLAQTLGVEVR